MTHSTPKQSVVVYGPQGCGKTLNAPRIMKALGLSKVHDEWWFGSGEPYDRHNTLLISIEPPPEIYRYPSMSFEAAMKLVAKGAPA